MTELWLSLAFVTIGALFCLKVSWTALRKARSIEDTPTSKITSAAQGYVELIGSAKADQELLSAPLTNTPCLWYRFQVERYETSGKRSSWRVIRSGTSERSFFLDDDSGICHIHPEGADVSPLTKAIWHGNSEIPLASSRRAGSSLFMGGSRYRYSESRIQPNDLIYGLGLFQTIHAETASEQAETKMADILSEWKSDHARLIAQFDTNADGEVSLKEWNKARQLAAEQAHSYVLENYDGEQAHILCQSPVRHQHFILASKNPLKLAKQYRWKSLAMLLAFIGLVAVLFNLAQSL